MVCYSNASPQTIRRDLHAYPEAGWKEYRTTALAAEALDELGYAVHLGADALAVDDRMGVPDENELAGARSRARDEGAPEAYLDRLEATTGLVAERTFGSGPTVGVRVDMDALALSEATGDDHRPSRRGFASRHPNEMHACGHDGHTAIGLGVARAVADGDKFNGTLKLFFQPAEEGLRGALAMSRTDHVADLDCFIALHLGLDRPTGTIVAGLDRPYASAKADVVFDGESAHAGTDPAAGRNALQAAATAITSLYGLPRDADGATRVNVGEVHSPNAQNVIADETTMRYEVRSDDAAVNRRLLERANRVLEGAATMHDVDVHKTLFGKATTFEADEAMIEAVAETAESVPAVDTVVERAQLPASEDVAHLIERVQEEGGIATYVGIGASNVAGHHEPTFDFDEDALGIGIDVITETIVELGAR